MGNASFFSAFLLVALSLNLSGVVGSNFDPCQPRPASDGDLAEFALNFLWLSAEFFSYGALGKGVDDIRPDLASGGPPPIGGQMANLDPRSRRIIEELLYQTMGHIRAVKEEVKGSRPLINLSNEVLAAKVEQALGYPLTPKFDAYANELNFWIAIGNPITYNILVTLVGVVPEINLPQHRALITKILSIVAGQNAIAREFLYERAMDMVVPYNITVADFVNRTSTLSNQLGKCGVKDEGIEVPRSLGAENRTDSNILAADVYSLSYSRTTQECLRISYGTGNECIPGGFYPNGVNGKIGSSCPRN